MTGEWLFSVAAFGQDAHSDDEAYFSTFHDEVEEIREPQVIGYITI